MCTVDRCGQSWPGTAAFFVVYYLAHLPRTILGYVIDMFVVTGLGCVPDEDVEWLCSSVPSRLFFVIPCHHCILVTLAVVTVCTCQMDG